MPFDQIQCADLTGWSGDGEHPNWRKVMAGFAELVGGVTPGIAELSAAALIRLPSKPSIAIIPFTNLSNGTSSTA
jgi:hypothetical protein